MSSAADLIQHGGAHYKEGGDLQHWNVAARNCWGYFESAATKYITRRRKKAGRLDVEKAGHYLDKLIELAEAGEASPVQTHKVRLDSLGIRRPRVGMEEFANANGLDNLEADFCLSIDKWSATGNLDYLRVAKRVITDLLAEYPPAA